MLHKSGYDEIKLISATKGMNQNISRDLIPGDYSYYIENIMPKSLGEGDVRYGNALFSDASTDNIIKAFSFIGDQGQKQKVIYFYGFQNFTPTSNLRIISSNEIQLTSENKDLFEEDTFLRLTYRDKYGTYTSDFEIKNIVTSPSPAPFDTIKISVSENSFGDDIKDFFIDAPSSSEPEYFSSDSFYISVDPNLIISSYYYVGQKLRLTLNGINVINLEITSIDDSIVGEVTFVCSGDEIPVFDQSDIPVLSYESSTPEIIYIENTNGYIKVLDVDTDTFLPGADQTLSGLSVACIPRSEFFDTKLWICNGVDDVITWDGSTLEYYEEEVKEQANVFSRTSDKVFTFVATGAFDITKYQDGKSIRLHIPTLTVPDFYSTVSEISISESVVTVTVIDDLPTAGFQSGNRIELFYYDRPPAFSFIKSANNRLWCLPPGAVSLDYRPFDTAMKVYFSYRPVGDGGDPFRFFNEKTKFVPSVDISAKHEVADNLEAICVHSGRLVFIGRNKSQIWRGFDPLELNSTDSFGWESTIDIGIYHGNLLIELPNDVWICTQSGHFASFGTLNISRQFAVSNISNMDNIASEYINSIKTNIQYRACESFKYSLGAFCGFKIGHNKIIISKYHTSLYWWCIFSGDFANASTFETSINGSLYLYIKNKIYIYSDGLGESKILYGDRNGERFIDYVEIKNVNNIEKRFANKRYYIECDYSSSVIINNENTVKIFISGDLRDTFRLDDNYKLPLMGDVLGTISLVNPQDVSNDLNYPDETALGARLDIPHRTIKGRLQFISERFSVTIAGQLKNGPFRLKRIHLLGVAER